MSLFWGGRRFKYEERLSEIQFHHKYAFVHHCDLCGIVDTNTSNMRLYELETLMKEWESTRSNWAQEGIYFAERSDYHSHLVDSIRTYHWVTYHERLSADFYEMYCFKRGTGKDRSKMIEIDTYIKRLEHYIEMHKIPEHKPYWREHINKPASLCR